MISIDRKIDCVFPGSFSTARPTLRPITIDDARAIFDSYGQDPEETRYLAWRSHRCVEDAHSYVHICLRMERARVYKIALRSSGRVVGAFYFRKLSTKVEYGCALARPYSGRRLMTEALSDVVDWAHEQSSIWRIGAVADVDDLSSIRVMKKASREGDGAVGVG